MLGAGGTMAKDEGRRLRMPTRPAPTEIAGLDPCSLLATTGKRVIHAGGRSSSAHLDCVLTAGEKR